MENKNITIYYASSSHWDREWYIPFQGFRYNLVKMTDDMVKKLENDENFDIFFFDGQTIVLEDYKEIAGDRADRLKSLINKGRVLIGPWYIMPDEFLVSGESLIRNLMTGSKVAEKWGVEPWKYGFANDIFGHIAQMPQIFAGFGIKGVYLGRGLGNDVNMSHFRWRSPDGTEAVTFLGSYGAFNAKCAEHYGKKDFDSLLKDYIDCEIAKSEVPVVLIMHTGDHIFANENVPDIKKRIGKLYPNAVIKHTSLTEMVKEVEKYYDKLPVVNGELIKTCKYPIDKDNGSLVLVANSNSSYYTLKQKNDYCQNLLEKRLEPMIVMSEFFKHKLDRTFVDLAYNYLLKNQPHDSICGCSIDKTHNDMHYRYAQIENIGDALKFDFLYNENERSDTQNYTLTVYNFEPYYEKRTITADLEFSGRYAKAVDRFSGREAIDAFEIFDKDGNKIPYQIIKTDFNSLKRINGQQNVMTRKYTVSFVAELPAFGYVQYKIAPTYPRAHFAPALCTDDNCAENKYIRLSILQNGELEIFDKVTEKKYSGLNRFYDDGEMGDGWWHMQPKNDSVINSISAPCIIEKISSGSISTVFKITKTLSIPEFYDENSHIRSVKRVDLKIESIVTVNADSPLVEIKTTLDNCAKDHRLRVVMPTGIQNDSYFAGQTFYKVVRKTKLPDTALYYEREMPEKNMNGIIGIKDKNGNGLAFVSAEGLHEGSVNECGNIAVTMLRSFHRVFLQPDAVNSQLQQKLEYKYAFIPLNNETEYCDLLKIQNRLAGTIIVGMEKNPDGKDINAKSLIEISNNHIMPSIIKNSQDESGKIIRVFNSSDKAEETMISLHFNAEKAFFTNLNEEVTDEIELHNNSVKLKIDPWKIVTVKII